MIFVVVVQNFVVMKNKKTTIILISLELLSFLGVAVICAKSKSEKEGKRMVDDREDPA